VTEPDKADELLSKADALLGRYRPAAAAQDPTALPDSGAASDFPVLTEVVALPGSAGDTSNPAAVPLPELPPLALDTPATGGDAIPLIDHVALREEILATLAPELEQRLSDTLKPRANELLDWAMQTVQLELGLSIRAAVRSAVAAAVDEALERQRKAAKPDGS
jgi:hypothetical protein